MAQTNRRKGNRYGVALSNKWIVRAVLLAALVHIGLWLTFQKTVLKKYGDAYYERLVPRSFKINRVEIDSTLLDPPTPKPVQPKPQTITPIKILDDTQEFAQLLQDVTVTPAAPEISDPLPTERPQVDSQLHKIIQQNHNATAEVADASFQDLHDQLLENAPTVDGRPLIHLSPDGATTTDSVPEFTNLDALLNQSGPAPSNQPILMDAGLLYDYDSFTLAAMADSDLQKLAELIQRSPNAKVVIEGHSDSFGSDQYNLELSQKRAYSVKQWLIDNAGIPASRLATIGYGSSRLIVPADRSIEAQQINRRVEVIIKTLSPANR